MVVCLWIAFASIVGVVGVVDVVVILLYFWVGRGDVVELFCLGGVGIWLISFFLLFLVYASHVLFLSVLELINLLLAILILDGVFTE